MGKLKKIDRGSWNQGFSKGLEVINSLFRLPIPARAYLRDYISNLECNPKKKEKPLSRRVGREAVEAIAREFYARSPLIQDDVSREYDSLTLRERESYLKMARVHLDRHS